MVFSFIAYRCVLCVCVLCVEYSTIKNNIVTAEFFFAVYPPKKEYF